MNKHFEMSYKMRNITILLVALLITAYFSILFIKGFSITAGESNYTEIVDIPQNDTSFGGIFSHQKPNDSLPHYRYRIIEDSFKLLQKAIEDENKSKFFTGKSIGRFGLYSMHKSNKIKYSSFHLSTTNEFIIATDSIKKFEELQSKIKNQDSIKLLEKRIEEIWRTYTENENKKKLQEEETVRELYYIGLNGYYKEYETKFFIKNDTYNLAYVVWDSLKKKSDGAVRYGHYEQKQIPVRYSEDKGIMFIPISKASYKVLNIIFEIFFVFISFIAVLVYIVLPATFLLSISKGKAFTARNIGLLKLISYSLIVFIGLTLVIPYFLHFLFHNRIPEEFKLVSFRELLFSNLNHLFIAIAVFLIMRAFKKGYKLQQEQDLTV